MAEKGITPPTQNQNTRTGFRRGILAAIPALLLTGASLLSEYVYAGGGLTTTPESILRPFLIFSGLIFLLVWPMQKATHRWEWTTLGLFSFALIFYFSEIFFYVVLLSTVVSLGIWALVSLFLRRTMKLQTLVVFVTAIAGSFFLYIAIQTAQAFGGVDWTALHQRLDELNAEPSPLADIPDAGKPDIYYIVLDGDARSDILKDYFGYDDSQFREYLARRGFIVPPNTHSNYGKTMLSVPATLNYDYIADLAPGTSRSSFWWLLTPLVRESRVKRYLEQADYHTVSIASYWDITDDSSADQYIDFYPFHLSEYEAFLLIRMPIGLINPLLERTVYVPTFETHRDLIQNNYKSLVQVAPEPGPKFVFAHIIAAHPPFVFDQNGAPVNPTYRFQYTDASDFPGTREEYRQGYADQVAYIDAQLEQTIDAILAQSKTPPIIILQADHGSGLMASFHSRKDTCLPERYSEFAAYHLPGMEKEDIPDDITPVNLFRIIFNHYFSAHLPLLKNSFYYSWEFSLGTEDITPLVENGAFEQTCTLDP